MPRTPKVTANHVKFARFSSVKEQKHDFHFVFLSMYNKPIIGWGLGNIQNNQGLGKGYQPRPSALGDNPYLDLKFTGYHKNLIK